MMSSFDLQKLARYRTSKKEAGVALLLASGVLAVCLLIPGVADHPSDPAAVAVAIATSSAPDAFAHVQIEARAAVVYDLATHTLLYAKNADAQLPLASLTKLLTLYSALSVLSPGSHITIPQDVMGLSEPHAFTPGQVFTLENLARLTLTASLNDGAQAIAEATADVEHRTIPESQAAAAKTLGLTQTYAVNGNGLDVNTNVSGGYGSAYDLARLAGALVAKYPDITSATTHPSAQAASLSGKTFTVQNTDPMVTNYPHLLLSKTGYTDLAGGNLALVFDVGMQHRIAIVVLGSTIKSRFTDGSALIAATLAHFAGIASL